ncbi:MAG TPA: sulfatase [Chthonomonadaceae bacterium]|nr:sulfatase [Chthonomonadaceae bacterium]
MRVRRSDRPNLLIFAIDSLRADHCSAYGYPRLTTPHADRLAARGVLFENHYSAYIPTTPAYSTILTGRDVMAHEMVALSPMGPIDLKITTLPEALRAYGGYASIRIGFSGDFFRGFDRHESYDEGWVAWPDRPARKAENLNGKAIPALEELVKNGGPWLLFIRHMDPHAPYLPPPPFDTLFYGGDPADPALPDRMGPVRDFPNFADFHLSWMPPGIRDITHPIAMYDSAVAYMDACIAAILNRLEELGQTENTLVVWTADHGETLDEHGCYFDHHGLYEPTLHVPLILSQPGRLPQGQRVSGYTLHEDLMPTLLEYVGQHKAVKRLGMEGCNALPLISGERATNHSEFYITECTWMRKRGWRTAEWKLIEALEPDFHGKPPVELYNLVADPGETDNLYKKEPRVVQWLQKRMDDWIKMRLRQTRKPDPILQYELGLNRSIGSIKTAQELQSR